MKCLFFTLFTADELENKFFHLPNIRCLHIEFGIRLTHIWSQKPRSMEYRLPLRVFSQGRRSWVGRVGTCLPTFLPDLYWIGKFAQPHFTNLRIIFGLAHPLWGSFRCPCFFSTNEGKKGQHLLLSLRNPKKGEKNKDETSQIQERSS